MERLKTLFAKQADPYAGADLDLTRRLGGVFWLVNSVLAVGLWPLSPLDRQIGDAGWIAGDALIIAAVGFAVVLRTPSIHLGFRGVLVSCYVGAVGIAGMQWLAGGGTAPYDGLLLNILLLVAATNPPRKLLYFLGFMTVLLAAPLAYGASDSATAAKILAEFVIWTPLAFLVLSLMTSIRSQRLALRREEELAREEARFDDLTRIPNRRAFDEAIQNEISRSDRMETPLCMAMGDLEHFKQVNDRFGHLEGDNVLYEVAQAIDEELRTPDSVYRWGGDEFALLLPGTSLEDGQVLIDRLQEAVAQACVRPDGEPIRIFFAVAEHARGMTPQELCAAADLALMQERASTHRTRA